MYYFKNRKKPNWRPRMPKKVKTGVCIGERYTHPDGQVFEIVELYGGVCVSAVGTEHDLLAPLEFEDISKGWSCVSAHDFNQYVKEVM